MDQVKAFAKVLWEQRFWVLCALGTFIAGICWMKSTGDLQEEFVLRKQSIEGNLNAVTQLRNTPVHPNEQVNEVDRQQALAQRQHVLEVWQELYERQREEVLYWPRVLGEQFIEEIENKKFRNNIPSTLRDTYRNYIKNRFQGLLEIVDAREEDSMRGGGRRGGGMERGEGYSPRDTRTAETEEDYLVLWLDQDRVRSKLNFGDKPTSTQIWVTQEDLWVYDSLLNVIAKTNEARGATRPDNAAVKAIVALEVGQEAVQSGIKKGSVMVPKAGEGATGGMGGGYERGGYESGGYERGGMGGGEMGGYPGGGEMGGGLEGGYERGGYERGGMGGGTGAGSDTALLESRYLDDTGKPYPGDTENFGVEFRQLPVHMVLMMDQRWLPQVLVECANAALPVEVTQVRLNPNQANIGGQQRGGARRTGVARNLGNLADDPTMAEVEIMGKVYIYNEPSEEALNVPGVGPEQLAAGGQSTTL